MVIAAAAGRSRTDSESEAASIVSSQIPNSLLSSNKRAIGDGEWISLVTGIAVKLRAGLNRNEVR